MLKRSCLAWLLVLAGIFAVIYTFIIFNPPTLTADSKIKVGELPSNILTVSQIVVALLGSLLLFLGLGYPFSAGKQLIRFFQIVSVLRGKALEDKKAVTIVGPIKADKRLLSSPGSGESCVAYVYKIYQRHHLKTGKLSGRGLEVTFSGYAMTPSYIDSSVGPIKLLAVPDIDLPIMGKDYNDEETLNRVKRYLNKTKFIDRSRLHPEEAPFYLVRNDLVTDRNRSVRQDIRYEKNEYGQYDLSNSYINERLLRPNEIVCATGIYSSAQQALIQNPKPHLLHSIQVKRGPVPKILLSLIGSIIAYLVGSFICLALLAVSFWAYYNLYYLYDLVQS